MEQACDIASLYYDILSGYEGDQGRARIFATDEDVLREVNALYLPNIQLKWLDSGTRASAFSYCAGTAQDRIKKEIGDPAPNDVAKGMILLQNWWIERVMNIPVEKCSIYSEQDRGRIWDAFSADQQFNNDGSSSIESYQTVLSKYTVDRAIRYHDYVRVALRQVFPNDAVLTSDERARILAIFDKRTDFGAFMKDIQLELDVAQGLTMGPLLNCGQKQSRPISNISGVDTAQDNMYDRKRLIRSAPCSRR
jgi:hypothetical protein